MWLFAAMTKVAGVFLVFFFVFCFFLPAEEITAERNSLDLGLIHGCIHRDSSTKIQGACMFIAVVKLVSVVQSYVGRP